MLLLLRSLPDVDFGDVLTLGHQRSYIGIRLQKRITKELGAAKNYSLKTTRTVS